MSIATISSSVPPFSQINNNGFAVSLNFFGTPYAQHGNFRFKVEDFAARCLEFDRNKKTFSDYVNSAYFMKKADTLYKIADKAMADESSLITQIFIKIRKLLASLSQCFAKGYTTREEIQMSQVMAIFLPRALELPKDFLKQFPPLKYDGITGDAIYDPVKFAEIAKPLRAKAISS
jgi:hypothetical protein